MEFKLDFLKKKKNFKKKDNPAIDPNVYWRVMLFLVLFIVLVSLGLGFYLVKEVNKEPETPLSYQSLDGKISKKGRIDAVLEYYANKEKKSDEIKSSTEPIIDPSI